MVLGKLSTKMRGCTSAVSWVAWSCLTMRFFSRKASGVRRSEAYPASAAHKLANTRTGRIALRLDTPAARMAVISPSAAMRPNPIRIPTSTPKGIVRGKTGGRPSPNNSRMVRALALERTSSSKSGSTPYRKTTNVASSVPSTALARISRKMYRPNSRTALGLLSHQIRPNQIRRRHHLEFRQFFLHRVQFQIVDQNGGRHYAGFGREPGAAHQGEGRGVTQVFESRAVVPRGQNIFQGARIQPPESQTAHEFLMAVRVNSIDQDGHTHWPLSSCRTSPAAAEEGKSILRTMMPYGLLRARHRSISFFFSSAAGTVSVELTNRFPMVAALE